MKIDITSMFFNSRIEGQTATPAWGTSIGQNKSRDCRIDDFKQEVVDMVIGMTYKSVADLEHLDVSKGSSDRDIITCSVFENVYINNKKIENAQYVLLLVREHSKSHDGRLIVSYAPYIKYNGIDNQSCIDLMQQMLGCSSEGCWFVYDISIKNQSELYFSAVVVNATAPMVYSNNIKSKNRSEEWKGLIPADNDSDLVSKRDSSKQLQQIFYGAPGTGKSNRIKEIIQKKGIDEKEQVFRTTFHPDSDYSTFVGCYKPIMKLVPQTYVVEGKEKPVIDIVTGNQSRKEEIVYDYTPQAFIQAYTKAWANPNKPVILVIEEINRGNCAQIFGDIFQLLDRGDDGASDYEIKPDKALEDYLKGYFTKINDVEIPERIKSGTIMKLPSNLYIWATMNTSDQSLFPIDSAFKRRWDWVYMPIDTKKEIWHIKVGDVLYSWTAFLEKINNEILTDETAEDKHLGFYFCKAENNEITQETFVGKVLFYLWNDVFKVYGIPSIIGSSKEWAYTKFYNTDGKVNEQKVKDLMAKLQIAPEESNGNAAEESSEQ